VTFCSPFSGVISRAGPGIAGIMKFISANRQPSRCFVQMRAKYMRSVGSGGSVFEVEVISPVSTMSFAPEDDPT
jgi:hypothetical protein